MKLKNILGAAALATAIPASAGIISTYSDLGSFQAATAASNISGAIPNVGNVGTGPYVLGDVTLDSASGDLFLGTQGLPSVWSAGWSSLIAGNDIALSGTEDLDVSVNLGAGVTAFGFEMHEPIQQNAAGTDGCNTPGAACIDSTFELFLWSSGALVDSYQFNLANDQLAFVGVETNELFDTVQIREKIGGIDNEYFGQFYASVSVPEPATLGLLGLGLAGLGIARRRVR